MSSPRLVDLHSHFFGPVFYRTLAAAADREGRPEPGYARLRAARLEIPEDDIPAHVRRWLAEMDRHNVSRMISFASVPEEAPSVGEGARLSEGRLVPFSLIDPAAPGAGDRVRLLVEAHGMRGFVLFPAMHRYDLSDRSLEPFFRNVEVLRLPVIVHLGVLRVRIRDLLGLPSDFDLGYAVPGRLEGAAARHAALRFVIPHFGGGYFRETLALAALHPNLSVDTSSSNGWAEQTPERLGLADVFRRAYETLGPRRIHFGTDSSVFPRGWRRDVYDAQRAAMREAGIPPADEALILAGNTDALLDDPSGSRE